MISLAEKPANERTPFQIMKDWAARWHHADSTRVNTDAEDVEFEQLRIVLAPFVEPDDAVELIEPVPPVPGHHGPAVYIEFESGLSMTIPCAE